MILFWSILICCHFDTVVGEIRVLTQKPPKPVSSKSVRWHFSDLFLPALHSTYNFVHDTHRASVNQSEQDCWDQRIQKFKTERFLIFFLLG